MNNQHSVSHVVRLSSKILVSLLVPVIALYYQYDGLLGTAGITLAFFLIVLCALSGNTLYINKPFALFTLFYIIRLCANLFLGYGGTTLALYFREIILIALVSLAALMLSKQIEENILYKMWSILGSIVILMIFYQSIRIYVMHQYAPSFVIGPISRKVGNLGDIIYNIRPSACFSEPSCVVDFLAPILSMSLNRKKMMMAILVSIAILLGTSTNGVVTLITVWCLFLVLDKEITGFKKIFIIITVVILTFAVMVLPIFSATISKLTKEMSGTSNSYVRITFGFETFFKMSSMEKIFGIPDYSIEAFRMSGRIKNRVINTLAYGYANGASTVLIRTGILGGIFWLFTLLQLLKKTKREYIPYFIALFITMFSRTNFFNPLSITPYIFILFAQHCDDTYKFRIKIRNT